MKITGVDGCKYGWIAVSSNESFAIYKTISDLVNDNGEALYLIDIPIGLSDSNTIRDVDQKLRSVIKHKASSVFTPPCRDAVYCDTYDKAKIKNIEIEGKSISIQAWNISSKIKEVDQFLLNNMIYNNMMTESFPELGFFQLNKEEPLKSNKKLPDGISERLEILKTHYPDTEKLYNKILNSYRRKIVQKDDILDAMCLMLVGKVGIKQGFKYIQTENTKDSLSQNMRIFCLDIKPKQ